MFAGGFHFLVFSWALEESPLPRSCESAGFGGSGCSVQDLGYIITRKDQTCGRVASSQWILHYSIPMKVMGKRVDRGEDMDLVDRKLYAQFKKTLALDPKPPAFGIWKLVLVSGEI